MRELNKKNALLILASIAIVAGAFYLAEKGNSINKSIIYVESEVTPGEVLSASLSNIDSDNDGLMDWEEVLWGMDPHKTDSNNNGVLDSEEVTTLIKKNEQGIETTAAANAKVVSTGTQTEEFSKKFFTNYLELRKSGNMNEISVEDLVSRMAEQVTTVDDTKPQYSLSNIKTFPSQNKNDIKNYANTFGSIRNRYQKAYENNPLPITEEGPNFEDPNFLKAMERVSNLYKNLAAELSTITVPQSIASTHVELLNTYVKSAIGLYEVSTILKDPIVAMKGISRHQEATVEEIELLGKVAEYFDQIGVYFISTEPGSFFETYK